MPGRPFDYLKFAVDIRKHPKLAIWNTDSFQKICGECNCSIQMYDEDSRQIPEMVKICHEKLISKIENLGANKEVIDRYKKELNRCYESRCGISSADPL